MNTNKISNKNPTCHSLTNGLASTCHSLTNGLAHTCHSLSKFYLRNKESYHKMPYLAHAQGMTGECGRSMVEMLGVLAVIGVLSVGGIAGYKMAMTKHKANELLSEASKRAVVVAAKIASGQATNINEFDNNKINGSSFDFKASDGISEYNIAQPQFAITVDKVAADVCEQMVNTIGSNAFGRKIIKAGVESALTTAGCTDNMTVGIVYNKDMASGADALVNDTNTDKKCTDDAGCEKCQECSPAGYCVAKTCGTNETCNITSGECECKTNYDRANPADSCECALTTTDCPNGVKSDACECDCPNGGHAGLDGTTCCLGINAWSNVSSSYEFPDEKCCSSADNLTSCTCRVSGMPVQLCDCLRDNPSTTKYCPCMQSSGFNSYAESNCRCIENAKTYEDERVCDCLVEVPPDYSNPEGVCECVVNPPEWRYAGITISQYLPIYFFCDKYVNEGYTEDFELLLCETDNPGVDAVNYCECLVKDKKTKSECECLLYDTPSYCSCMSNKPSERTVSQQGDYCQCMSNSEFAERLNGEYCQCLLEHSLQYCLCLWSNSEFGESDDCSQL